MLLALEMDKGPWACRWPLGAGKGKRADSPLEFPKGTQPFWPHDCKLLNPFQASDLQNYELMHLLNLCFKTLNLWQFVTATMGSQLNISNYIYVFFIFFPTDSPFSEPSQSMWIFKLYNWVQWNSWLVEFQAQSWRCFGRVSVILEFCQESGKVQMPGFPRLWCLDMFRGAQRGFLLFSVLRGALRWASVISSTQAAPPPGWCSTHADLLGDRLIEWLGPISLI